MVFSWMTMIPTNELPSEEWAFKSPYIRTLGEGLEHELCYNRRKAGKCSNLTKMYLLDPQSVQQPSCSKSIPAFPNVIILET